MAAAHYRLDNLVAILDHNTLQITGRTRDVMSNEPLEENGARSAGRCAPSTATTTPRSPPH
jgi:transketolase N-terminal domain/subunit